MDLLLDVGVISYAGGCGPQSLCDKTSSWNEVLAAVPAYASLLGDYATAFNGIEAYIECCEDDNCNDPTAGFDAAELEAWMALISSDDATTKQADNDEATKTDGNDAAMKQAALLVVIVCQIVFFAM